MNKKKLKSLLAQARKLKSETNFTEVVFQIYANGNYILDTEEDNVIDVVKTEEEAIELVRDINSGEFSDDGSKSDCYYKPILIDKDSGERITRKTLKHYLKRP